ncbi:putative membrane protein [Sesbania bispinosa]|nr:putative membrane protein [Sesbania bispinosa]
MQGCFHPLLARDTLYRACISLVQLALTPYYAFCILLLLSGTVASPRGRLSFTGVLFLGECGMFKTLGVVQRNWSDNVSSPWTASHGSSRRSGRLSSLLERQHLVSLDNVSWFSCPVGRPLDFLILFFALIQDHAIDMPQGYNILRPSLGCIKWIKIKSVFVIRICCLNVEFPFWIVTSSSNLKISWVTSKISRLEQEGTSLSSGK